MYRELAALNERPAPFSVYTTDRLWTDDYVSGRMLKLHLDPDSGLASRTFAEIDSTVGWLDRRFGLAGKAVCDLGCGPGLYADRMASRGARVTGLDFSPRSIAHARASAEAQGLDNTYRLADYLEDDLPERQDIVLLIFCDLCVLSPEQRAVLYAKVRRSLGPGGRFVFDVCSAQQFAARTEETRYGRRFMDGFWSPHDYFGFLSTFRYDDRLVSLDRYLIVEKDRTREICNWLQYFSPQTMSDELTAHGFSAEAVLDVRSGDPWKPGPSEFAVVAAPGPCLSRDA